jgi:hypothetical protein
MRDAGLAFTCALLVAAFAEGGAQTRQLEMRVDSLARIAQRTRAAVLAYDDSLQRIGHTLDTARAATPLIVAGRSLIAESRAIAPAVVDSLQSTLGRAMSRVAGYSFRAEVEHRVGWRRTHDTTRELVVSIVRPNGVQMRAWRSELDSANLFSSLLHAVEYAAFAVADPEFFAWAGNGIPDDTMRVSEWAHQRLLVLSAASAVGNRCFRGDLPACKSALLLSVSSDPIRDWHDSTTRRGLVERHGTLARRLDTRAGQQCLAGSDSACITVLHLFPPETFLELVAASLRFSLVRHALAVGGAGSVERLLMVDADNPAERLEAAARMPIDSLVASWQARVRDTRAPSEDLTIGITIMSLAWAAGIGALSLRSSRWR